MAKLKPNSTAILTANDLLTGTIVYWTGTSWSRALDDAKRATDGDAHGVLEAIGRAEEAVDNVVGAYLVVLDSLTGKPIALRERQRWFGPSVALPTTPAH
ncbi:DUF2849 domain-containing protein [Acuticoccus sp. MNP-M23]|uniref:DUF2849 domain-containing protein n=1 Tax=Acuticoccus sp. MNP-M23 TaxID=3072793 RepID=UPI00281556E4|nr:DUF2849 domain-containing protein [Acuticoccus sp. MNP-M23]WMS43997.1 DUF2849 domain-containing protein [Acuticoccus sp. MNP-M23]